MGLVHLPSQFDLITESWAECSLQHGMRLLFLAPLPAAAVQTLIDPLHAEQQWQVPCDSVYCLIFSDALLPSPKSASSAYTNASCKASELESSVLAVLHSVGC